MFLHPFFSMNFPLKLYAATGNNCAPSNVTLLTLATRTGKGFSYFGA